MLTKAYCENRIKMVAEDLAAAQQSSQGTAVLDAAALQCYKDWLCIKLMQAPERLAVPAILAVNPFYT